MGGKGRFLSCWLLGAALLAGTTVRAQQIERAETVTDRNRPALDAQGIPAGSFRLFPVLAVEGLNHSNIFAQTDDAVDDFIMSVRPSLSLESDWNKHALILLAGMDIGRYADNGSEDYDDFSVSADGRVDISRISFFSTEISHEQTHEQRTSADDIGGINPTEFTVDRIDATYFRKPNRSFVELNAIAHNLDFDDVATSAGIVSNDDRDRQILTGTARFGYEMTPDYSIFVQGETKSWEYDQQFDDAGFQRNSDGYEIVAGTALDFSGVTFGDFFVGFRSQEFDDLRFATVEGISFGGDITWNITGLTTLNALANRTVEPTTIVDAAGILATRFGIRVDHELLRNLILSADLTTVNDDYQGIDREDDVFRAGFAAKYMLNRKLYLYLGYNFERRDTALANSGGTEYRINKYFLRLQGQL